MLQADRHNYIAAFRKHYHAYSNWDKAGSIYSKRLILTYCVECGLKYLLMEKYRILSTKDAGADLAVVLSSHDFYMLLKKLDQAGNYHFPRFETARGESVTTYNFHEVCRYCLSHKKDAIDYPEHYQNELAKVASWIDGMVKI